MSQSDSVAPQSVVFIASNVPDLQDLLGGLAPGVQAFVIDPSQDGLDQIADLLATNNLSNLASISIVAHGASGELELGSSPLISSDLASSSNALAEIGASLVPGGIIQLYGCDVAEGAGGQQFIDKFSTLAGGATVEAATHVVGSAAYGGSWALDAFSDADTSASDNSAPVSTSSDVYQADSETQTGPVTDGSASITGSNVPFTPTALANFQGELTAAVQTELWITAGVLNSDDTELLHVDDSGSGGSINNTTLWTVTSSNAPTSVHSLVGIALDPVDNVYFLVEAQQSNNPNVIWKGTLSSELSSPGATPTLTSIYSQGGGLATTGQITGIGLNAAAEEVYFGQGHGIYEVGYSGGTVTTLATTGNSQIFVDGLALDLTASPHPEAFFFSHTSQFSSTTNGKLITTVASNAIYVDSNLSQANVTPTKLPMSPADGSLGANNFPVSLGLIEGIAVDPKTQKLYFTTTPSTNPTTGIRGTGGIYEYNLTTNGAGTYSAVWIEPSSSSLDFSSIEIDDSTDSYYVTDANESSGTGIYKGSLTSSAQPTLFASITSPVTVNGSNSVYVIPEGFDLDNAPTLSGITGIATDAVQGGAALTLLTSTPSASDPDGSELAGATIQITNGKTGDELFVDSVQSGTLDSSRVTVSWNATSFALTLSGADLPGDYAALLSEVSYQDTGTDTTTVGHPTRSVAWSVTDGLLSSTVTDTTVTIDRPPTQVTHSATVLEGGTVGPASVGDTDPDGDTLFVTSVTGGTVGSAEAGTYGSVTISANDTYTYSASNTAAINAATSGSHPVDTFTYTVSDNNGGTTLETLSVKIDRPPTAVSHSYELGEGGTATATSGTTGTGALNSASDLDGDSLTVVAVDGSAGGVGNAVTGSYGQLTLNVSGGFSYVANNTTAINSAATGSHPIDTFTYTISDGDGGSATANLSFTIDRPASVTAGGTPTFIQGGSAVVLDSTLSASAPDTNSLVSATVVVSGGFTNDGDVLAAGTSNSSITVSYNSTTETLSLSGSASVTAYESVLDSVTFQTSNSNPSNFGANPTRTITWTVYDGEANGGIALAMQTLDLSVNPIYVPNGVTSTGLTISSGVTLDVLSGGSAVNTIVDRGGTELLTGGTASATTVSSGGWLEIFSGGTAPTFTLKSGGMVEAGSGYTLGGYAFSSGMIVEAGSSGTVSGGTASSGGTLYVQSHGIASSTAINSGGWEYVLSGGSDFGAKVAGAGFVFGYASGTMVSNSGALAVFGSASGVTILSGGYGCVEAGGTATGTTVDGTLGVVGSAVSTTVSSGGQLVFFGTTTGTVTKIGGLDDVESGGVESAATISSGGADVVMSGGFASGTTVSNGGVDYVMSGGTASGTIVSSGGFENVLAGGSDLGGKVSSGGVDFVYGYAGGTVVSSGGALALFGSGSGMTIAAAGYVCVETGGTATSTTVDGTLGVAGSAVSTTISGGGAVAVAGTTTGTTIRNGGVDNVRSGGVESAATISSGGADIVLSGGLASGTTVSSGGVDYVTSGGTGSGTIVSSGGFENLLAGGSDLGGKVSSGGVDFVHGYAGGTVVSTGGVLALFGSGSGMTVSGGGYACIEAGGTATGTVVDGELGVVGSSISAAISSGGNVTTTGKAGGTIIDSGGIENVASGGTESGATISGGALELESGGSVGMVTFADNGADGGIFQIDQSAQFTGLVAGFSSTAPEIAFLGIPYVSGTTTYSWSQTTTMGSPSGTLTVHDGADSANITLLGSYAAGQFALAAYSSGTLVTDPPLPGSSAMLAGGHA